MDISIDIVKKVFVDLLDGRITRDAADRWAYSVKCASDSRVLIYLPPEDENRIWDGIMFLYGVDLLGEHGNYLHNEEEIRDAMQEMLNDKSVTT
jgi:hypothetical protein